MCNLLNDSHRSVVDAAYQVLGPFIHTFQDPTRTGFILTQDGGIVYDPAIILHPTTESKRIGSCCNTLDESDSKNQENNGGSDPFNALHYWRVPLPDVVTTPSSEGQSESSTSDNTTDSSPDGLMNQMSSLTIGTCHHGPDDADSGHPNSDSPRSDNSPRPSSEQDHDDHKMTAGSGSRTSPHTLEFEHDHLASHDAIGACPAVLFDLYLRPPPDDTASFYCAHSLPAVAVTVGRMGWSRLKDLYEILASHTQWRVRWTLACSAAVLAQIVGDSATFDSLKPTFDSHLKDVDEVCFRNYKFFFHYFTYFFVKFHLQVRIGALRNFTRFVAHLPAGSIRDDYLMRFPALLSTDNPNNWRLRYEVGRQLADSCELFSPECVVTQGVQIAHLLLADRANIVRQSACRFFAKIVHRACYPVTSPGGGLSTPSSSSSSNLSELLASHQQQQSPHSSLPKLLENLTQMAQSTNAKQRILFVWLCRWIAFERSIPPSVYTRHLLPSVLSLCSDPVLAVRIALSRLLSQHIMSVAYFTSSSNPHCEWLSQVLEKLREDTYVDVRNGLSLLPGALINEYQMPSHPQ